MNERRQRIIDIAKQEFPSSEVTFDDDAGRFVRFRITLPNGIEITRAHPHFYPSEIDNRSEEELRKLIRSLCGFSEQF
jgi:hypothetical protein